MQHYLSAPKSLTEFKIQGEEIKAFEGFKHTELNIHYGFKQVTRFDEQRVEFRPVVPRRNNQALRTRLLSTLGGNAGEADLKHQAETVDWNGLLELYAEKITADEEVKSKDSPLRGAFRRDPSLASTLHSLTEMIPDDEGLSVLRFGLAYVLLAWKRHIETRNRILDTLAGVPRLLSRIYEIQGLYKEDRKLFILVEEFHASLLESLIALSDIVSPSRQSKKSWVKRAWRKLSEQESEDVDAITNNISAAMTMISERGDQLLHQRVARLVITGEASRKELQAIRKLQTENSGYIRQVLHKLETRPVQDGPIAPQQPRARMDFRENVFLMMTADMASVMQTGLYNIVSEDRYIEHYGLWPETSKAVRPLTPVAAISVTRQGLLRILRIQETDPPAEADAKYVLRRANSMQQRGLSQAQSLMAKNSFKSFLAKDKSGMLLVDGHCKEDGDGKTSPLSVWAASFAASFMQSDSVVVLYFFCGLHSCSTAGEPPFGPLGLVKSLVEQSVRYSGDNVSRMGPLDKVLAQEVADDNFEAVLSLFKLLLMSLDPRKTVFIVIDNASEFEGVTWNEWSEQMLQVFKTLYGMVRDQATDSNPRMQLRIKVLMTNANKSTVLARHVEEGEVVSLY